MRAKPPDALARHFDGPAPAQYRVRDNVRRLVTFGQVNLLDEQNLALVGRMDAIFCRNVMIYFDLPARRRVLRHFYDKLAEGGYLLLGHSENLINVTADFELVHLRGDLVYRRPRS
jgi:chemotaxis protein methyltransferase CheR